MTREGRSPNSANVYIRVLEIKVYKNPYSVVKCYFRFEKLLRNRDFTGYRVLKLRCLLDYNIIFICKYVNLASKFLI